ncbi:hypothetical protein ACSBR1_012631 [Camellia fascicularis]
MKHNKAYLNKMDMTNDERQIELLNSQAHIWNHIFNFISSMSLKCAIQLGIPDIIYKHGRAMPLSMLVVALPINHSKARCVYRLMLILVYSDFFTEEKLSENAKEEEESYLLTPASWLLLKDEPLSVKPFLLVNGSKMAIPRHLTQLMGGHSGNMGDMNQGSTISSMKQWLVMTGGTSTVAKAIADAFPNLRCTVLDLPHVVSGLQGMTS